MDLLADLDPHGLRQSSAQAAENSVRETQACAIACGPCEMAWCAHAKRESVQLGAARGRNAQLGLALQVFVACVKVAVPRNRC